MCIIGYKPIGVGLPKDWKNIVKYCFKGNSDGAGMMYRWGKQVYTYKGYMTVEPFIKAIEGLFEENDMVSVPFAIHFRVKTHGDLSQSMCHPFPLSEDKNDLKSLTSQTDCALMHNGIFSDFKEEDGCSDSAMFAQTLGGFKTRQIELKGMQRMLNASIGYSRVLIFTPSTIQKYGDWNEEEKWFFSNNIYKYQYNNTHSNNRNQGSCYFKNGRQTGTCEWCEKETDDLVWRGQSFLCHDCVKSQFQTYETCKFCGKKKAMWYMIRVDMNGINGKQWICDSCERLPSAQLHRMYEFQKSEVLSKKEEEKSEKKKTDEETKVIHMTEDDWKELDDDGVENEFEPYNERWFRGYFKKSNKKENKVK